MILSELICKKGVPKVWCDSHNEGQTSFAVWDFDEEIILTNSGCFLNGELIPGNPVSLLQNCVNKWKKESDGISAVGFFSYDFKKFLNPHIHFNEYENDIPFFWFGKPKKVFTIDKDNFIDSEHVLIESGEDSISFESYHDKLAEIKYQLAEGNVYQINFTYPKIFSTFCDPFNLYLNLRKTAQPQFGWFYNLEDFQILSFSPERFFRVSGQNIYTYPIKGTRHRSIDLVRDEQLAEELFQSEKDRAEHLMIVDLLRNDLGKVCNFGSVKVKDLYKVESYETVHHMVTEIKGALNNAVKEMDIISALFPGGSITGTPKERAMQIIDSLENYSRGIYTGSIGYITADGEMDFNIAIRTMTIQYQKATYPVGGGIVWDSIPEEEWQETILKAKILENVFDKTKNKPELVDV